jgi:hypothetical protein
LLAADCDLHSGAEDSVESVLCDGLAYSGCCRFVKSSVLIGPYNKIRITDDVIRKYRIGNPVGNTGINTQPDVIFGHGELFAYIKNFDFHVDDSNLTDKGRDTY